MLGSLCSRDDSRIRPLGLVTGLGMDYPHRPNSPGFNTASHLVLCRSVPVMYLVNITPGMYQCLEVNFHTSERLINMAWGLS